MKRRVIRGEEKVQPKEDVLRQLLLDLAPDEEAASEAMERIERAIEGYSSHKIYKDEHGVRHRGSVSKTRKSLSELEEILATANTAVRNLRPEAIRLFCKAWGAPRGGLAETLKRARIAAAQASKRAQDLPDKVPDIPRHLLAWNVARVFGDVLGRKPAATRDDPQRADYPRGGAAFARVLRVTFAIAGITSKEIGPDIDAGLRLLREEPLLRGDVVGPEGEHDGG